MAVEITISHVIKKMKYLQNRKEMMSLSSLTVGIDESKKILERFHQVLRALDDTAGNSSAVSGWKTKHSKDLMQLLHSTEDDIDSFLVQTALAKDSPVVYFKSLSNQRVLGKKMHRIFSKLQELASDGGVQLESPFSTEDLGDEEAEDNKKEDPRPESNNVYENSSSDQQQVDHQVRIPPPPVVHSKPRQLEPFQRQLEPEIWVQPSNNGLTNDVSEGKGLTDGASDLKVSETESNGEIVQMEVSERDSAIPEAARRWKDAGMKVTAANRFRTRYVQDEDKIVGMKEKVEELGQMTLNRYTNYFPIAIVGRAGSGKTFLVRQIFNLSKAKKNFDKFAFVSISQNFKERDVLVEILEQVAGVKDHNESSSDELKKKLGFFLTRKRYLIVLDDVHKADVWDKLKSAFQNPLKGSRVILTIREVKVARRIAPTVVLVHLHPLTHEESWQLFSRRLRNDQLACPDGLKKQILDTCEGLPLQILVLAGLLSPKPLEKWSKVLKQIEIKKKDKKRVESEVQRRKEANQHPVQHSAKVSGLRIERVKQRKQQGRSKEGIAARDEHQPSSSDQPISDSAPSSIIFDMGFQELNSTLKACFCYLCLFPKSSKVRTRKLCRLLVAEGLVTSASKSAEVVVYEYLEKLESRNMIEYAELTSDGMPKTFQVPTALYDKFISNAKELGYQHITAATDSPSEISIRKLSVFSDIRVPPCKIEEVRSYICFDKQKGDKPAEEVGNLIQKIVNAKGFGLMTVLDLEGVYKPQLPKTLGQVLPLLKFVGLRETFLDSIPDSVGDLSFLETLDVKYTNIARLPISVWNARELQHLYMNGNRFEYSNAESSSSCCPGSYPTSSCYPSKLLTLIGLLIGNNNPPVEWLKRLTDLRKLGLTCHTGSLGGIMEWIVGVPKLETLKLRAINEFFEPSKISNLESMNELQELTNLYLLGELPRSISTSHLPPKIKILTLSVSRLSEDPMEVLSELKELKVLELLGRSYMGHTLTCPSKGFGNLQVLKLWMLTELKRWIIPREAMPKLTKLEIRLCEKLGKPDSLEHLTSLKKVTLTNMGDDFVGQVKECLRSRQEISIHHPTYRFDRVEM